MSYSHFSGSIFNLGRTWQEVGLMVLYDGEHVFPLKSLLHGHTTYESTFENEENDYMTHEL